MKRGRVEACAGIRVAEWRRASSSAASGAAAHAIEWIGCVDAGGLPDYLTQIGVRAPYPSWHRRRLLLLTLYLHHDHYQLI